MNMPGPRIGPAGDNVNVNAFRRGVPMWENGSIVSQSPPDRKPVAA